MTENTIEIDDKTFLAEFGKNSQEPTRCDMLTTIQEYLVLRKDSLSKAADLGLSPRATNEVLAKAAKAFLRRWMMLRFAVIDLSFAENAKWWLEIDRNDDGIVKIAGAHPCAASVAGDPSHILIGRVDRYFSVHQDAIEFGLDDETMPQNCKQNVGVLQASKKKRNARLPILSVNVTAKVPDGITPARRRKALHAIGHYCLAESLLFSFGLDLVADLGDSRNDYSNRLGEVQIIWAPKLEALTVETEAPRPKGDPAIIYNLHDESYVLDFYDAADEQPIEHLIREFSEGKLPKAGD